MTKPDLKPCPFCGGEATAENLIIDAIVRCSGCSAVIAKRHPAQNDNGYQEAIAAWNTRAIDPAAIREAALREAAALCDWYPYVEGVRTAIYELMGVKVCS